MNVKRYLFSIVFLFCSQQIYTVVDFRKTNQQLRRELYYVYKKNPDFCRNKRNVDFEDAEFWVAVLEDHSMVLRQKIAEQRSCLSSRSCREGLILLSPLVAFFIMLGTGVYRGDLDYFIPCLGVGTIGFIALKDHGAVRLAKVLRYIRDGDYIQKQMDRLQRDEKLIEIFKNDQQV